MTEAEMASYIGVYGDKPNSIEIAIKHGKLLLKGMGYRGAGQQARRIRVFQ